MKSIFKDQNVSVVKIPKIVTGTLSILRSRIIDENVSARLFSVCLLSPEQLTTSSDALLEKVCPLQTNLNYKTTTEWARSGQSA